LKVLSETFIGKIGIVRIHVSTVYIRLTIKPVLELDLWVDKFIKNCGVRLLSNYNINYIGTIYTRLDTCLMSISRFSLRDKVTLRLLKLYFYIADVAERSRALTVYIRLTIKPVLELDLWIDKFLFFLRRDLNSHHWYTTAPIA
jgi:hypothetical protein